MTTADDPGQRALTVLTRALAQAGDVLARVRRDQLAEPTPCADWAVSDLVAHLVAAPRKFAVMVEGGEPDWSQDPPPVESAWDVAFRAAADDLLGVWRRAEGGVNDGQLDWQTAEIAVHTWDLARASRQPTDLDPEVAERGYAFMSSGLTADNRSPVFGAEVPVPDDAPAYDRLAALAGRDPSWRAPGGAPS